MSLEGEIYMIEKELVVIECLSKIVSVKIEKDMKLIDDLGLNSLQLISVMFNIEKKGLFFKKEFYNSIETVEDLINNLEVK